MRRFFCRIAVLAAVVVPASADIVKNGQFLTPTNPDFITVFAGQITNTIPDWTITQRSVDWIGSHWTWGPPPGGAAVDLNGDYDAGGISQTIHTAVEQSYWLSFWLAGNPDDGYPTDKKVTVSAGTISQTYQPQANKDRNGNLVWTHEVLYFVASDTNTLISFTSNNAGPYGPVLADVSVPEAGFYAYSAFALGLSGLFMLVVRCKRQA